MVDKYAGLTLGVDISQVDAAVKSLSSFKKANEDAAQGMQTFVNAEEIAKRNAKDLAKTLSDQAKAFDKLENTIDPTASKMKSLTAASKELDALWKKGMVPDETFFNLSSMIETQTNTLNRNKKALTEEGRAAQEEAKAKQAAAVAGEKFLASLQGQADSLGKSATELLQMKAAQLGVSASAAPLIAQMEQQAIAMEQAATAAREKAAADKAAAAAEQAANSQKANFIKNLQEEADALGKSRVEILQMKAAQLGVSEQAAPLIAQLQGQTKQLKLAGISAGQYNQAMRMLPAQITDVVTSLSSGMPVWMVAIQQGGQIKDSFGGIGNTFKALLSYLNPVNVGIAAIVVVVGALAKAAYDAAEANKEMSNAIILSGNYAQTSSAQLKAMINDIEQSTSATSGAITSIATSLVSSGKYTQQQIAAITKTTAEWSAVTGDSADKIIGYFDKIATDPVKGLKSLNDQFNFLDKGQLTYINNLKKTQGESAAVTAATKIFADTMDERLAKIADNATPLEKMWNDIKKWSSDAWKVVGEGTVAALNLVVDAVTGVVSEIKYLLNQGDILIGEFVVNTSNKLKDIPGLGSVFTNLAAEQTAVIENAKKENEDLGKTIDGVNSRLAKGLQGYIDLQKKSNDAQGGGYSTKNKDAVDQESDSLKKQTKTKKTLVDYGDRILTQYNEDLVALQSQLAVLQQHKSQNDKISQQRKDLWTTEARYQALTEASQTRQLSNDEKSYIKNYDKIHALAEQKAVLGDQIVQQEQQNKLLDDANKKIADYEAKTKSINETLGMGSRQAAYTQETNQLTSDWTTKGGSTDDAAFKAMMKSREQYYAADNAKRADWLDGAKSGFQDWADSATDMYTQAANVSKEVYSGMSSELTDFLTSGKADWKSFTVDILKMITQMLVQMALLNSMKSAFSGTSIGSFFGFANGGVVGKGFAGGGYTGDGGKYQPAGVVHAGEFVMTKEATRRIGVGNLYKLMRGYANGGAVGSARSVSSGVSLQSGNGGGGVNFNNMQVDIGSLGNGDSDARSMESGIKQIIQNELTKSCQQGGAIYNYVKSKTG